MWRDEPALGQPQHDDLPIFHKVWALTPMDLWNPYEGSHQTLGIFASAAALGVDPVSRLLWLRANSVGRR